MRLNPIEEILNPGKKIKTYINISVVATLLILANGDISIGPESYEYMLYK